jgi:hypothetical protein
MKHLVWYVLLIRIREWRTTPYAGEEYNNHIVHYDRMRKSVLMALLSLVPSQEKSSFKPFVES